jgi:hypothetical protein
MDPLNDLDRELSRALLVEPSGDFTARVRARMATEAPARRWSLSGMALVAGVVMSIVVVAINLSSVPAQPGTPALPHQDLAVFTPLSAAAAAESPQLRREPAATRMVLVAPSEMLALQRLFSGEFVAPPEAPAAEELIINEVAIAPIAVPVIEGEQR